MLNFMVNAEGGLTTAGYAICIVLGIVVFGIALFFAGKNSEKNKMSAKQLACCAMAMALAFITSYIKIFSLPWGGSVTLCSMLFIVLVANWYGVRTGILVGFTYGMLQFLQEPYVLSLFQVCSTWCGRFLCKAKEWTAQRLYRSCSRQGSVSCAGRIFVLDGLHAGQFPEITCSRISDRI